ncbi:UNVERIFIED_ORG: hypothetical protein ABIB19_002066 [Arthrobacter sp. UYEF10]
MNEIPRPQRFNAERSGAIAAFLANVAQDGTPENRHFQNTKGKRILLAGVAVALVATGGAVVMQLPVTGPRAQRVSKAANCGLEHNQGRILRFGSTVVRQGQ